MDLHKDYKKELRKHDFSKMKYTSEYVRLILEDKIVVCESVYKALLRIPEYLEKFEFKQDKVDNKINFIETETAQTKGSFAPLKLALVQKVWLEPVWGFYGYREQEIVNPETMEFEKKNVYARIIHEVPIIMGRGNGKTTLGSGIAITGLMVDNEYGADVQILANVKSQSNIAFEAVKTMIGRKGTKLKKLNDRGRLRSTRTGIKYEDTNSVMSVKASDYDTLDGTNAHYNIFDEVHAYDIDFIKVVNDGSKRKRLNWITWYLTTNGTKREAVFDTYYTKWKNILDGYLEDFSTFPWIYEIDSMDDIEGVEENHDKTRNFQKSNPMIGIMPALSIESILEDIKTSKGSIMEQQELLAKTFNKPVQSHGAYFSNLEIDGNSELFDERVFIGEPTKRVNAILGADLSEVNDIASLSLMTVNDGKFYFKTFNFLPRRTVMQNYTKDRRDFMLQCEHRGELILHDYDMNNIDYMWSVVHNYMKENYIRPIILAPDRWHADKLEALYNEYYGLDVVAIPQGAKTLSQPLQEYKTLLNTGKIVYSSKLVKWAHGNVIVEVDNNNNIKPSKKRSKEKIDPFAAQLDAYTAYTMETKGILLQYPNILINT